MPSRKQPLIKGTSLGIENIETLTLYPLPIGTNHSMNIDGTNHHGTLPPVLLEGEEEEDFWGDEEFVLRATGSPYPYPPSQRTEMVESTSLGEIICPPRKVNEKGQRGCRAGQRVQQKKEKVNGLTGIYNLTNVELTKKGMNILNSDLKCAVKKSINKFDVYIDIHKCIRKINMKKYFLGKRTNTDSRVGIPTIGIESGLRNKSSFNPLQSSNQHVEVFKQLVLRDLEGVAPKRNINPRYIQERI